MHCMQWHFMSYLIRISLTPFLSVTNCHFISDIVRFFLGDDEQ